jgi:uncharacterized protein
MSLSVNIKKLEDENDQLEGELSVEALDLGFEDEVVRFTQSLKYELEVQRLQDALLITGELELPVTCECVRCLREIPQVIRLQGWACHIPLEGEDRPPIVKDSVDLTPYIREDIVLALPTHPVCRDDCPGLTGKFKQTSRAAGDSGVKAMASPWDELNKLKLKPFCNNIIEFFLNKWFVEAQCQFEHHLFIESQDFRSILTMDFFGEAPPTRYTISRITKNNSVRSLFE